MSFPEQPPSKQWAALKFKGENFAEVWFKPEGDPLALIFRIPRESFHIPGMGQHLTIENLLKGVGIVPDEVESWRDRDVWHSSMDGSNSVLKSALAPPARDVSHVDICVRLKPPARTPTPDSCGPTAAKWQDLEARWKAIVGLEAAIDSLRTSMEGLLLEMEASLRKTLTIEEKSYALRADISQWERAKTRVHFALPKLKEFIHRSTWAQGSPERKRLGELHKDHIEPRILFPGMDETLKQLEDLQKDRQVLSGLGKTVYQEARAIAAAVQSAMTALQSGAKTRRIKADNASKSRFFK